MRAAVILGVLGILWGQDERVVPVHEEPRHRLVFETSGTRILDIQIPPGDTTLYHTHSHPILYLTMSTSRTRSQTLGGEWTAPAAPSPPSPPSAPVIGSTPPARPFSVVTYAQRALTHRVNNQGDSLYRLIGMTNDSGGDTTPDASAGFDATPELTNQWFRAYRWPLPEQVSAEHRHANPVVIVVAAGSATVRAAPAAAKPLRQPGAFAYIDSNVAHTLQGTAPNAQVMEVEIRRPR